MDLDIKEANLQEAQNFKNKNTIQKNESADQFKQYNLTVNDEEFAKYGIGLMLYFKFMKYLIVAFTIMSLISLPSIISNLIEDGLANNKLNKNNLALFTLANQPQPQVKTPNTTATQAEITALQIENDVLLNNWIDKMETNQYLIIIPDIVYSVFFFLFIYWFRFQSEKLITKFQDESVLPSSYSIEVQGIPATVEEKSLIQFFQNLDKNNQVNVKDCQLIKNYFGTLDLYKKASELLVQLKMENKRQEIYQKLQNSEKVEKSKLLIEKINLQHQEILDNIQKIIMKKPEIKNKQFPSIKAFITFNNIKDKEQIITTYAKYQKLCGPKQPKSLQFEDNYPLKIIENIDEPSNIKWENLDISSNNRRMRTCCVYLIAIVLMCLTFSIIIVANVIKPQNTQSCPLDIITINQVKNSTSSVVKECFCQQQSASTIIDDNVIQDLCWETYIKLLTQVSITILTGFVIFIVNFLLQLMFKAIATFQKYRTNSDEQIGQTIKLFVTQFINTAIISLIMSANFFGFIPAIFVTNIIPPIKEMQQYNEKSFYEDFNRSWYTDVGVKMTITMIINIFSPHLIRLLLLPIQKFFRQRQAYQSQIQRDMNNLIVGPEFELTTYYVSALNTIFCTLFYSGGIPLLLWLAIFAFALQYFTAKYFLLRFNKKPPIYDAKINKNVLRILPYSILIHMCISLYMYGQPLIFPGTKSSTQNEINTSLEQSNITTSAFSNTGSQELVIIARVIYKQIAYLIALVVLIGAQTISVTMRLFVFKLLKYCGFLKKQSSQIKLKVFGTYEEEYQNMSKIMIASYNPRLNDKYVDLICTLHGENVQEFQEQQQKENNQMKKNQNQDFAKGEQMNEQNSQIREENQPLNQSKDEMKVIQMKQIQIQQHQQIPQDNIIQSLDNLVQ